jgi:flavin-dependent dehydrogenase
MAGTDYDVIVGGGGPAGSTVATLLAGQGHRVLLAERAAEPEFKIGESLMPATYWTLERLGMLDRMRSSAFPQKRSVQFYAPDGKATAPFYFHEFDDHESSQTWQVVRSEFDQMLLDNARERGVEVRRGWSLREILFDGEQAVGARLRRQGDEPRDLSAKVVVDATGQSRLMASKQGILTIEPRLRHVSFYTHYEGAERGRGIDEGATVIFHTANRDSWFWYIPLPGDRMSVGVVGSVDHLVRDRAGDPERIFAEELALCPALQAKLASARPVEPMRAIRDFSYGANRVAGPGWVLTGDAYGFIDPIYSSGVFLALKSGEMAADAIHEALVADDLSAERLGGFEPELRQGSDALRKLVYAFYDREFHFGRFLRRHPDCREQLIDLLMGNVFRKPVGRLLQALDEVQTVSPGSRS